MAVVSAAVAAVAAAIATTTVATVATAVVAVSTAVGVLGLATTAIGLVTKNEGLLKAGKIMGYVGLAGGLAGGAIGGLGALSSGGSFVQGAADAFAGASQHLSNAWDKGVGSWFSPSTGADVAGAAGGPQGIPNGINPTGPTTGAPPPVNASTPTGTLYPGAGQEHLGQQAVQATQANMQASQFNAGITPPAVAPVSAPVQPYVIPPSTPNPLPPYVGGAANAPSGGFLSNMPDWAKFAGVTTGMQGISGLASGYFAGKSAEEKLNLEKQMNDQRQGQVNYMNQNAAYAPLVQFRRGFVQGGA